MGATLSYPAVDLAGKVALVTGANTGIGYETAKALAAMGAHTIIACRSKQKAAACVERMKTELTGREITVETLELDLTSFRSTRECADAFKAKNLPLHLLINNAGVGFLEQLAKTEDGNELVFQVNHLSPLLLTLELLPTLIETVSATGSEGGDCRIVWIASRAHESGRWTPSNLNAEISYSATGFYSNSKLYNVMTAFNMQRRLQNSGITVSCLHPGVIKSELWRHLGESRNIAHSLFAKVGTHFMRNVTDGAATTINCAVNPALNSQQCFYYSNCAPKHPTAIARNQQYQEELWYISIKAIGEFLSPEVVEKYGTSKLATSSAVENTQSSDGMAASNIKGTQPAATTEDIQTVEKPPTTTLDTEPAEEPTTTAEATQQTLTDDK